MWPVVVVDTEQQAEAFSTQADLQAKDLYKRYEEWSERLRELTGSEGDAYDKHWNRQPGGTKLDPDADGRNRTTYQWQRVPYRSSSQL